jgi:hypothetical protein
VKGLITLGAALVMHATTAFAAQPVEERHDWQRDFEVSGTEPRLEISNIWGTVRVSPGPDGVISVTARERRTAPDSSRFERSREVLPVLVDSDSSGVYIHVGGTNRHWYRNAPCRGCRLDVEFEVRVPENALLDVRTVNDGKIEISGVHGTVRAANVNGPVMITDALACEHVETVNGRVRLSFSKAPAIDCTVDTINGDIWLQLPEGAGLDAALVLSHGHVLSELPVSSLAVPARVDYQNAEGQHRYQISQPAGLRIAGGGPEFTFSSLNGDVHIQKTP